MPNRAGREVNITRRSKPYRIVSLDGGGIRGLYSAILLQRLETRLPGFLDGVALFAGTSSGGIMALALAGGLPISALVDLYRDHAPEVFDDSWLDDLRDLGQLIGARYNSTNLARILEGTFGRMRLKDLPRKVVIPAFDLDNEGHGPGPRMWKPKFFHNFGGAGSDGKERVVDVALRTCAAPTFFPTHQGYIDGGVVANNPGMAALAQALDHETGGQRLGDIRLFSLGSGLNPAFVKGNRLDWGLAQWARPIISLMMEGVMGVSDYECARLLGAHYHRLAPTLPEPVALDAWDKTAELIRYASQVRISRTIAWLRREFV